MYHSSFNPPPLIPFHSMSQQTSTKFIPPPLPRLSWTQKPPCQRKSLAEVGTPHCKYISAEGRAACSIVTASEIRSHRRDGRGIKPKNTPQQGQAYRENRQYACLYLRLVCNEGKSSNRSIGDLLLDNKWPFQMRLEIHPGMKGSLVVMVLPRHIRCEVEGGGGGNTRSNPGIPKRKLPMPASSSSLSSWCAAICPLCSYVSHQALHSACLALVFLPLLLCLRYPIVYPLHLLP